MEVNKKTQKKYVSVRKALRELRVNEDELDKIIAKGGIKAYKENNEEVKFDADELVKYRASCIEDPKIADESLYESMDGSFDSLFLSQSLSGGQKNAGHKSIDSIPEEPDVPLKPEDIIDKKKRENIEEYLQKKKAKPVSPVKAIYDNKSREKALMLLQVLLFVIIVITSVNSYLLLQSSTHTSVSAPEVKRIKAINDEILPKLILHAKIVPLESKRILSPSSGILRNIPSVNQKISVKNTIINIENNEIKHRELELQEAMFSYELIKNKLKKIPSKIQKELDNISDDFKKQSVKNNDELQKWLSALTDNKKHSSEVVAVWLESKIAEMAYHKALSTYEKEKSFAIEAPFDGIATIVYGVKDTYVQKGDILVDFESQTFTLEVQMTKFEYLQLDLQEIFVTFLETEQEAKIIKTSMENDLITLQIKSKKELPIKLGKNVKVVFNLNKKQCIQLSYSAIFYNKDIKGRDVPMVCKILQKKDEYIVFPITVTLGVSDGEYVEIISGIDEDSFVAVESSIPLSFLRYNQKVNVK